MCVVRSWTTLIKYDKWTIVWAPRIQTLFSSHQLKRESLETGSFLFQVKWKQGWRSGESTRSRQCGPGSIPGLGVICGLRLLLVLVPAPRVFVRVHLFSSFHENQHFRIPIRPVITGEKSHSVDSTEIPVYSPCLSPDKALLRSVLLSVLIAHMEEL